MMLSGVSMVMGPVTLLRLGDILDTSASVVNPVYTGCPQKNGHNSYLNAAIGTSKTIFEILMKGALNRAQELYDSMQN